MATCTVNSTRPQPCTPETHTAAQELRNTHTHEPLYGHARSHSPATHQTYLGPHAYSPPQQIAAAHRTPTRTYLIPPRPHRVTTHVQTTRVEEFTPCTGRPCGNGRHACTVRSGTPQPRPSHRSWLTTKVDSNLGHNDPSSPPARRELRRFAPDRSGLTTTGSNAVATGAVNDVQGLTRMTCAVQTQNRTCTGMYHRTHLCQPEGTAHSCHGQTQK